MLFLSPLNSHYSNAFFLCRSYTNLLLLLFVHFMTIKHVPPKYSLILIQMHILFVSLIQNQSLLKTSLLVLHIFNAIKSFFFFFLLDIIFMTLHYLNAYFILLFYLFYYSLIQSQSLPKSFNTVVFHWYSAIWLEYMSYQELKYYIKNMVTTFSTTYYCETIINVKIDL